MKLALVAFVLLVGGLLGTSSAFTTTLTTKFTVPHRLLQRQSLPSTIPISSIRLHTPTKPTPSSTSSASCLHMMSSVGSIMNPLVASVSSRLSKSAVMVLAASALALMAFLIMTMKNGRRILYPRSQPDASFKEIPLPPGSLGCPFLGKPFFWGSQQWGAGSFYLDMARTLKGKTKNIFKYYFMGIPFVAVGGTKNLQKLLNQEFDALQVATRGQGATDVVLMGEHSLVAETSRPQHQFLRRLIGQALTPSAVAASLPTLQASAQAQVDKLLLNQQQNNINGGGDEPIFVPSMERVCTDFTLDVAWKQILGLNLHDDEIPRFTKAVDDWVSGIASVRAVLNFRIKESKGYKALKYLESKVEQKINDLERNGPDASTLSGMVFATDDDEGSGRKLSRQQIIDNAMLLIIAGSETSASTLTNAMMCLGLHKDTAWKKLVQEQRVVQAKYGDQLTKEALDSKECPYLDAVIKESLRIRPISGGIPRIAKETMFFNDPTDTKQVTYQIPKGWVVDWSATLTHELDPVTYQKDGSHMDIQKGFVPERWLQEETIPADFVPMGTGPRYCLGSNLAYAEMKVFLAVLARNVDFDLAGNTDKILWKRMSIIPQVKDGVPVTVRPLPKTIKVSMPSSIDKVVA